MDNTLNKVREAVEDAIKPIIKKGENMTPTDLEALTKAVCIVETIKRCQCHYDDGEHSGSYSRRYYDGATHNGYSGHSIQDRMIDCLERMVDDAQTDYERQTVKKWIKWIRRMND